MKTIKKLMTLVLSIAMVLAMGVTAFADDASGTYTITINNGAAGHIYEAYQIFTGDLFKGTLSNIEWGNGINDTGKGALGSAKTKAENLSGKDESDAKTFSKEVAPYLQNAITSTGKSDDGKYTISGLHAGYYLVKDQNNSLNSADDFYTAYIMKVVGDVTATPKGKKPSFEKKIKDTNDTTGETSGWQDSADYDIGDDVPFQLKGIVAGNYDEYSQYYFAFHDVEEEGLTFKKDTIKVYVDGTQIQSGYRLVLDPNHTVDNKDCTFDVVFDNLKDITAVKAGSIITVEYTSELNEKANLGSQGNVNAAKLEFSNNPNAGQEGSKGQTPWDNVIVFTYKVVVNKYANSVDQDDLSKNKLAGAEFTLEKVLKDNSKKTIGVVKSEDGTSFTFKGLDDGKYILTETKTPAEYNTIAPITFIVNADHTIMWDGSNRTGVLKSLTGTAESGEITFTANEDKSELATNVINKKGSQLPETGGMGTTIFYVVGTILVLAAVVLLITKKRMHADK